MVESKGMQTDAQSKKVLEFVIQMAQQEPAITRILLFGSRARQDHHERSDFDFAVEAPSISDTAWARWSLDLREQIPTLCGVDLVRIKTHEKTSIQEAILKEGIVIYPYLCSALKTPRVIMAEQNTCPREPSITKEPSDI